MNLPIPSLPHIPALLADSAPNQAWHAAAGSGHWQSTFSTLGLLVLGLPALLVVLLGVSSLFHRRFSERLTHSLVQWSMSGSLLAALAILALMLSLNERHVTVAIYHWVVIPEFHFDLKFTFDRLSVPFVVLTLVLCGTIGAFANRYLHRERGFNRFFVLYAIFVLGMIITALAGTIETLFFGWELVGLASALLVAYFHDRPAPVRNGLHVWTIYRLADAALLLASLVMHHLHGHGDFDQLLGPDPGWPYGSLPTDIAWPQVLLLGSLLLFAAMGKSAQVPFCGWLPRAMEGPTPSSAVFYGALSVHLGAFLLLRFSPLLDASRSLCWLVITVGVLTVIVAALAERVQTDIKSDLSFASLMQVGIVVIEIGCGLRYIPLIHILGHACFRTLQFLRAPTLLHDYRSMENALGSRLPHSPSGSLPDWLPRWLQIRVYKLGLEKGYLDALLIDYIAQPVLNLFRWCDRRERDWNRWLSGPASVPKVPLEDQPRHE
jgi:NAD(P)H-quinone oxidoreductase subunit 5